MTAATVTIPAQRPAPDSEHAGMWALVERAQAGDRAAFGAIYEQYQDQVFRFLFYKTQDRQTAEDLTADVFVRALNHLDSVTWQGRDIGAWLKTIARNLAIDLFKSARYRLDTAVGDVFDDMFDVDTLRRWHPRDERPDHACQDSARNRSVHEAVAKLTSSQQREVIQLRFFEGLSVPETAARMGLNVGAIKALQIRAIRSLRRLAPELEAYR